MWHLGFLVVLFSYNSLLFSNITQTFLQVAVNAVNTSTYTLRKDSTNQNYFASMASL